MKKIILALLFVSVMGWMDRDLNEGIESDMHLEYDHHYSPDDVERKTSIDFSANTNPEGDSGFENEGNMSMKTGE